MRESWRGPRVITAVVVLLSASAMASKPSRQISANSDPAVLARSLQSKDASEVAASAYLLGLKGAAAVPAIPRLVAVLGDDRPVIQSDYRSDAKTGARSTPGEEAAEALAHIGKPAVDPLILALRASTNPVARRNAAWALGQIDMEAHGPNAWSVPRPSENQQD